MGADSKIEWTTHSWNPWIGCTEVGPGCDHCYARTLAARYGWAEWGAGKPRHRTSESNWRLPGKWNRAAAESGERPRVFPSLCDPFDNEVPAAWRDDLWALINHTPHLDWLLLTKRIGNAAKMVRRWPDNVWLGISVVNQDEAERDIPKLLAVPARVRFLSLEPLLGLVDLERTAAYDGVMAERILRAPRPYIPKIDWVIVGGESGPGAREMRPSWAAYLRDQCQFYGVAFFMKQMTKKAPIPDNLMVRQFPMPQHHQPAHQSGQGTS